MSIGLVPYQWKSDAEMPHWALPNGATSAIDLRRIDQISDQQATGYAIAIYPDVLPAGSVDLDTGNVTRDRDAWMSTLGYRPAGANAVEWAWSHLMDGADDQFAAACRPLRGGRRGRIEMHLGGKHERALSHTERLVQAVLVRRDLDGIFDDVQAGRLPDGMHRKALQAYADDLGIDPLTLRSKAARWRNETPLRPTTSITDEGWSGATQTVAAYGWTALLNSHVFNTGGGTFTFEDTGNSASSAVFHPTALSSSNASASAVTNSNTDYSGPVCRGSGTTGSNWNGYGSCSCLGPGQNFLFSFVNAVQTQLSPYVKQGTYPQTRRVEAINSTIKGSDSESTWKLTVTNTAISSGLRAGLWGSRSGYGAVVFSVFNARDFLTPASISTSPSSGPTSGGTAITITGTGFESNATVTVKGSSATGVTVASETSITATTPSGTLGAGDVVVTNPDSGFSGTQTNGFTYSAPTTTTTVATTTTTVPATTTTAATTTTTAACSGGPRTTLGSRRFGSHRGLSGN